MTDQSTDQPSTTETLTPETPVNTPTPLEELVTATMKETVREDGTQKYSTVEAFLKGSKEAQAFIPQLQAEKKAMTTQLEELQARVQAAEAKATEYESKLTDALSMSTKPATAPAESPAPVAPVVDEAALFGKVEQMLAQREAQAKTEATVNDVVSHIQTTLGESANETFAKILESDFGGSKEAFLQFATTAPAAAKKLVDSYKPQPSSTEYSSTGAYTPKPAPTVLEGQTSTERLNNLLQSKGLNPNSIFN